MIDAFHLPGNRIVHPWHFIFRILRKFNWIRKYQLLQEREDLITLHVVPYVEPSEEQMQNVREVAAEVFGEEVEFKILLVPEIPYEKTGKFRVCRSLVYSEYDQV